MKKIVVLVLLVMALWTSSVMAVDLDISKRTRTGYYPTFLKYQEMDVPMFDMYYNYQGKKFPAYCLFQYMTEEEMSKYDEVMSNILNNTEVWKVLKNGYPNKTVKQLGCEKVDEAYVATGLSVMIVAYNYNINNFTITEDNRSQ